MSKIYEWLDRNKKSIGYVAAGIAVPTLMHLGFDSKLVEGRSIYDMTDSLPRFANYAMTSLAFGKAIATSYENSTSRKVNSFEKIGLYSLGAMAATGLWEVWENAGQIVPIHDLLRSQFGDLAKTNFPGSGMESVTDAALTTAGTTALVAGKEAAAYASNAIRELRNSRDDME